MDVERTELRELKAQLGGCVFHSLELPELPEHDISIEGGICVHRKNNARESTAQLQRAIKVVLIPNPSRFLSIYGMRALCCGANLPDIC